MRETGKRKDRDPATLRDGEWVEWLGLPALVVRSLATSCLLCPHSSWLVQISSFMFVFCFCPWPSNCLATSSSSTQTETLFSWPSQEICVFLSICYPSWSWPGVLCTGRPNRFFVVFVAICRPALSMLVCLFQPQIRMRKISPRKDRNAKALCYGKFVPLIVKGNKIRVWGPPAWLRLTTV